MKKAQKKTKRKPKLILSKESVRKLADGDLAEVVGAAEPNRVLTVSLAKHCL